MRLLIDLLLALALSVPVGAAGATFGALVLEFGLGLLVETGEKIEADPRKRRIAVFVLAVVFGGITLAICVSCAAVVFWASAQ
jgi:hypothetical protein